MSIKQVKVSTQAKEQLIRLKASNPAVKTGETMGDAAMESDGSWRPTSHETAGERPHLPPASGALIY